MSGATDTGAPGAPAQPDASDPAAAAAGAVAPLTPYQKRKADKRAREEKRQKRAAARAAKASATAGAAADAEGEGSGEPSLAAAEPVDTEKLQRSLAVFLRLLWRVAGLFAWMFGYSLDKLTPAEALEDAEGWVPVGLQYPWFRTLCVWTAAPVLFVDRIASKLRKREKSEAK